MTALDLDHLVQPDRVHRSVYTDQALFDLEMENMFEKTWVYCGHESQVKAVGDYHTLHIGRQPMVMVRDRDQSIRVLYNRCPHRGVQLCGTHSGNTGSGFVCPYHAWTYGLEGELKHIPGRAGFPGVELKDNGLVEVGATEKGGLVYVNQSGPVDASMLEIVPDLFSERQAYFDQSEYIGPPSALRRSMVFRAPHPAASAHDLMWNADARLLVFEFLGTVTSKSP